MHLSQLLYVSRSVDADRLIVGRILSAARRHNQVDDVTGLLLFDGAHFLQLLEGDRTVISRLYNRIAVDPRHTDVVILGAGPTAERICPSWSMGYVDDHAVLADTVLRFSSSRDFDPFAMTASSALRLARHVVSNAGAIRVRASDRTLTEA